MARTNNAMMIMCLQLEFVTGDNRFHLVELPVDPVTISKAQDGALTLTWSYLGYFDGQFGAIDLLAAQDQ
jgi:hypothetical protein